jgi:hypothetical protein
MGLPGDRFCDRGGRIVWCDINSTLFKRRQGKAGRERTWNNGARSIVNRWEPWSSLDFGMGPLFTPNVPARLVTPPETRGVG